MTVSEALNDAVKDGMERFAYSLLWIVQNGLYQMDTDINAIDFNMVRHDEVTELIESDALSIKHIQLYSMPIEPNVFLLVLAENEADAKGVYLQREKKLPRRIDDVSHGLDDGIYNKETGHVRMRDMKDETIVFPLVLAVYDTYKRSAEEVEQDYCKMFNKTLPRLGLS